MSRGRQWVLRLGLLAAGLVGLGRVHSPRQRAQVLPSMLSGLIAAAGLAGAMVAGGSPASAGSARVGSAAGTVSTTAQGLPLKTRSATPPVQATAIAVSVPVTPRWTRGVDGRIHVDYDLLVTNWVPGTVILRSVQVVGPRGAVLLTLAGANLIAHTHLLADLGDATPTAAIPASASVAIIVDVVLPGQDASLQPAAVPAALTHRIRYQLPANVDPHLRPFIGSLRVFGPQTPVAPAPPTVIAPPLRGSGWVNLQGCCQPSRHRSLLYTANGQWIKGETWAIDWVQVRNGRFFAGDGSKNTQWYYFGSPVRAVAGGMVVRAIDGRPDNPPRKEPIMPNPDSFGGNYVVVQIHPGVYAQYAHLKKGSVAVRVGQRIRAGQQLGQLGNSGNSTGPHLHFGLLNQPDETLAHQPGETLASSLPWVFNRFTFLGNVNLDTGKITTGTPHPAGREYPLLGSVVAFR